MYRYYKQYFDALTKEVMPFWMKNAIDESGAINNCISEDGTVLSRNRYIWSQGRALWTFSALWAAGLPTTVSFASVIAPTETLPR